MPYRGKRLASRPWATVGANGCRPAAISRYLFFCAPARLAGCAVRFAPALLLAGCASASLPALCLLLRCASLHAVGLGLLLRAALRCARVGWAGWLCWLGITCYCFWLFMFWETSQDDAAQKRHTYGHINIYIKSINVNINLR